MSLYLRHLDSLIGKIKWNCSLFGVDIIPYLLQYQTLGTFVFKHISGVENHCRQRGVARPPPSVPFLHSLLFVAQENRA